MKSDFSIAIFGGGNMGSALAYAINDKYPNQLHVYDRNENKCLKLNNQGIKSFTNVTNQQYDFIIIAVKPQQIAPCKHDIISLLKSSSCIISVAAGHPITFYNDLFPQHDIIRAMPTIAAKYGQSATACFAETIKEDNFTIANAILSCIGTTTWLDKEHDIHLATAIAGSGIAYYFKIIQEQINIAKKFGLDKQKAYKLISQALQGASAMIKNENLDPKSLIKVVASPNGVTEKAIDTMSEKNINLLLEQTIQSAINRSIELGDK